jgi:hypothetical protein
MAMQMEPNQQQLLQMELHPLQQQQQEEEEEQAVVLNYHHVAVTRAAHHQHARQEQQQLWAPAAAANRMAHRGQLSPAQLVTPRPHHQAGQQQQ